MTMYDMIAATEETKRLEAENAAHVHEIARLRGLLSKWGIDASTGGVAGEPPSFRVSLAGLLNNAAGCIVGLAGEVAERDGFEFSADQDSDSPAPDCFDEFQPQYYASALEEAAQHARGTMAGIHTVAEFADGYCLVETPAPGGPQS